MNRSLLRLLALVLPLAGLGSTWLWTHVRAQQGTEWDVPVSGYDPRDLLRGHYIVFRYDWPGLDPKIGAEGQPILCLAGQAPRIDMTHPQFGFDGPAEPSPETCSNPVKSDADGNLAQGRLYVPQDKARTLETSLRDPRQQGVVRIRVREDGHITPLRISFRPRPPAPSLPTATP